MSRAERSRNDEVSALLCVNPAICLNGAVWLVVYLGLSGYSAEADELEQGKQCVATISFMADTCVCLEIRIPALL